MTKNLILGPILAHVPQIWANNFFLQVLPLQVISHCSKLPVQLKGKVIHQSWENDEKPNF